MKPIKILSIDGGGIRGLIPTIVLAKIEEMTGKPVCRLFDLIAGTSTGGILALALTMPAKDNKTAPAYSAENLVSLYTEKGEKIFTNNIFHGIDTVNGLFGEKYPSSGIDSVLKECFGTSMLSEALAPILISAYEIRLAKPFFFKSRHAKNPLKENYDFLMWQVARATSAAPTYFEPAQITVNDSGGVGYYTLVDGGVYANNPSMCAFAEAKVMFGNAADIMLLSLGTGEAARTISYKDAKDWGLVQWAKPILDIVFDGISDTVDYQINQLLNNNRYYRMQTNLAQTGKGMDDASKENIRELKLLGQSIVEEWQKNGKLEKLCRQLT